MAFQSRYLRCAYYLHRRHRFLPYLKPAAAEPLPGQRTDCISPVLESGTSRAHRYPRQHCQTQHSTSQH